MPDKLPAWWPVLAVSGFSGSGKTTLLEATIPRLTARGWRVAVVKHDAHGLQVDRDGKDTARFFAAGATVVAQSAAEGFARTHGERPLPDLLHDLVMTHDVVLVEGYKSAAGLPRVWLDGAGTASPPDGTAVLATLSRSTDRPTALLELLDAHLQRVAQLRPVAGAVLIGGASSRMGQPKHLMPAGFSEPPVSMVEHAVSLLAPRTTRHVLLGTGEVPASLSDAVRLPDAPGDTPGRHGPLAGVLSALRWDPDAWWLVVPCDHPQLSGDLLDWLLARRATGCLAVAASVDDHLQPLPALLDGRLVRDATAAWRRGDHSLASLIRSAPGAIIEPLPDHLLAAMRNVNMPDDYARS